MQNLKKELTTETQRHKVFYIETFNSLCLRDFVVKSKFYLLLMLFIFSCSRNNIEVELDPEDEFKIAKQAFKEENYGRAIEGFKQVMFRHPGSKWAEESQYRLAQSSFFKEDYQQAEIEYEFFIKAYPRSRFLDDASFELALCYFKDSYPYYLDPSFIERALHEFQSFVKKYPHSKWLPKAKEYEQKCVDKLIRKDIETAKLYIKRGKLESAILYLEDIQDKYPETSYSKEVSRLLKECEEK